MAKLDIDFVLMDESVVMNGFRCLMSGYVDSGFLANPVMLCQHVRPDDGNKTATTLPIGKWYDVRVEDNKLKAKPDFDDADPFAMEVQGKVQRGYMNAASVWLEPMKVSGESKLKLTGQKLPTITQWGILEASIVDIPNCRNALAVRDSNGAVTKLSASADNKVSDYLSSFLSNNYKTSDMGLLKLAAQKLSLPDTTTEDELMVKLEAVLTENKSVTKLKSEKEAAEAKISELESAASTARVESIVDKAITEKKLAAGDRSKYIKLAKADFDTTKEILEGMKPYETMEKSMQSAGLSDDKQVRLGELMKLSYDKLLETDQLEELKAIDEASFKLKANQAGIKM